MRMRNELGSLAAVIDISARSPLTIHKSFLISPQSGHSVSERGGGEERAVVFGVRKTDTGMGIHVRIANDKVLPSLNQLYKIYLFLPSDNQSSRFWTFLTADSWCIQCLFNNLTLHAPVISCQNQRRPRAVD